MIDHIGSRGGAAFNAKVDDNFTVVKGRQGRNVRFGNTRFKPAVRALKPLAPRFVENIISGVRLVWNE